MVPIIIGAIMIVLGGLLAVLVRKKMQNKNIEIQYMNTASIPELKKTLEENAAQGLEGYREYTEIKGVAASDSPEKAPYSEKPVAYYDAALYQVFEEVETYKDDSGTHQRVNRREERMSEQKSSSAFAIKDAQSGEAAYVQMSAHGMKLDVQKTLDKFEPVDMMQRYSFFGGFQYGQRGSKTLGFRMVENTIPIGQPLYALGEAFLEGGRLTIAKPRDGKKPFIVSVKSEDDLVRGNKSGATAALVFGIILAVAGVAIMIFVR